MFLALFEFCIFLFVALILVSQIIMPFLHGIKMFPIFTKEPKIVSEIVKAKQTSHETNLEKHLTKIKGVSNAKK
jgi:hypothetical protein